MTWISNLFHRWTLIREAYMLEKIVSHVIKTEAQLVQYNNEQVCLWYNDKAKIQTIPPIALEHLIHATQRYVHVDPKWSRIIISRDPEQTTFHYQTKHQYPEGYDVDLDVFHRDKPNWVTKLELLAFVVWDMVGWHNVNFQRVISTLWDILFGIGTVGMVVAGYMITNPVYYLLGNMLIVLSASMLMVTLAIIIVNAFWGIVEEAIEKLRSKPPTLSEVTDAS